MTGTKDGAAGAVRIEFVGDAGRIEQLAEPWRRLCATQTRPTFFQSPAWCLHAINTRLASGKTQFEPCLVTFWRGEELAGLWPLAVFKLAGQRIARAVDSPFGQLSDAVFLPGVDEAGELTRALALFKEQAGTDGLMIEKVIAGTPLHQALSDSGAVISFSDCSVVADLTGYDDFNSFLKTVNKKTRKNMRNMLNRLEREGELHSEIYRNGPELPALIAEIFEQRRDWLEQFAMTAPAFRDPDYRQFVTTIDQAGIPDLIGFAMQLNGTLAAAQWGVIHQRRYYAYISSRNVELERFSAGRLHLGQVVEACCELGLDGMELMSPASDYKLNWTKDVHRIDDFQLAHSLVFLLYLNLWHRGLRTILRRGLHKFGVPIRRRLTRLINRG